MPWPTESKYLGKSRPRLEGPAKVTGRARFTTDVNLPGMLYGAILRSKWPAAHIRAIDLSAALAAPGIKAGVLAAEGEFDVCFHGAELAALAGTSAQAVQDALALIRVDAETKPVVVDEIDAALPDAPPVRGKAANLTCGKPREKGNADAAFASAAAVIDGIYTTPIQIHHPLEPHGTVAQWDGDDVQIWTSTQAVFGTRDTLAQMLKLQQNQVRVICEHMGGGFGAKLSPHPESPLCARLARAARAPVRLILTRFEQAFAVGNRPSSFQHIKMSATADGKLTGFQLESFGTPGFRTGAGNEGGSGEAAFPAPYIYRPTDQRVRQGSVAVNAGQSCPMRAPGHPVASAGIEAALDDLAAKLGLDPVEIRLLNDPSEIRQREYRIGAEKFGWKQKYHAPGATPGPVKVGMGCAGAAWMSRWYPSQAEIEIHRDGTVEVRVGTQDLGTGSRTVAQVVAAEQLQIDPQLISVRVGDSRLPWSGLSGGSLTTASIGPAIYDACENALTELKQLSGLPDPRGPNWAAACAKITRAPLQVRGKFRDGLSNTGACGVQFAEVEVDTETGFVKLRKMLAVQDCGTVVNRLTCESQINGGVIMGIGYALYEQRIMDPRTGVVLNPNFETYKLPGAADIPEIQIELLDMPERGIIGVGEPCTIPTAAAIANAVANAIGVRVFELPITPARVLAALGKVPAPDGERRRKLDQVFATIAQGAAAPAPAQPAAKESHA
ncbi:xanthine dehydrogenase family protein molybdopterin-binding subunit [Opitutus sp. ER46]|uniref:xanthine dehydrogenase family protein molybdopterin-binding subunit n=1 Tax=Opitutus sp. ER46 TaxID=2161864 RepID=UPI000D3261D4|nr:xanthine dehydrogenase family protein molybdopterin-binding subunit [Opitutus sp. ER46]PTX96403.1 hypothetical protein DB354_06985 [Opitutus sp. ER46]